MSADAKAAGEAMAAAIVAGNRRMGDVHDSLLEKYGDTLGAMLRAEHKIVLGDTREALAILRAELQAHGLGPISPSHNKTA